MKKSIAIFALVGILAVYADYAYAEEHKVFELKQGTHRDMVNGKYGEPIMKEKLKPSFFPISKEKALYKIDDSTYMILRFFSGRVHDITILEDVDAKKALSMFKE